jgi:hypothetical protein
MTQPDPSARTPDAKVSGCLAAAFFFWLESMAGIGIAGGVFKALRQPLEARGYDPDMGSGFMIALALGVMVALYPVIWLDQLRRRMGG